MSVKEAWKIVEVAYEGTSKVKASCLQLLSSKFEYLRMMEGNPLQNLMLEYWILLINPLLMGKGFMNSNLSEKF